jgi:3-oxoacyl-[acyl-carrier protein] reductase
MQLDFKDKIALVTGGTRGIGKAIVDGLLELGAFVYVTGTNPQQIATLNEEATAAKLELKYLQVDFSNPESTALFLEELGSIERIDVCINNAGVNLVSENLATTSADFDWMNGINLKAPYEISRVVGAKMIANGYGRIVNIASIWSVVTRAGRSLYTMTKWGLIGLTKTLSVEWAKHNVLVNGVSPGFTKTELTMGTNTEAELEKIAALIPINRLATTDEIASVVIFLSSNLNTYLTGQNITVDGGYTNI